MGEKQLSQYGATSALEGFAEFARAAHGTDVSAEEIARQFPKCAAFFRVRGFI